MASFAALILSLIDKAGGWAGLVTIIIAFLYIAGEKRTRTAKAKADEAKAKMDNTQPSCSPTRSLILA